MWHWGGGGGGEQALKANAVPEGELSQDTILL